MKLACASSRTLLTLSITVGVLLSACGGGGQDNSIQSIIVTPDPFATGVGIARPMRATGMFSDGTSKDITTTATWGVVAPGVATVARGVVTGVDIGSTSVTASVGEVSASARLSVTSNTWTPGPQMLSARNEGAAIRLPNGNVLVIGGRNSWLPNTPPLRAELFDPSTESWTEGGSARENSPGEMTSTLLGNGKVLVCGGWTSPRIGLTFHGTASIYDPDGGDWTSVAGLSVVRSAHAAVLLSSGRVLVVGGATHQTGPLTGPNTSSVELYDATSNTWTPAANMASARDGATATLLTDGKVLMVGGDDLGSAEIYDPTANRWTPAGVMSAKRYGHSATLLRNGKVLVAGGNTNHTSWGVSYPPSLSSVELFDPISEAWAPAASMTEPRGHHSATPLPDGRVLIAGGNSGNIKTAELYDAVTETWSSAGTLTTGRERHAAALLPNGSVLVMGGNITAADLRSTSEFWWP